MTFDIYDGDQKVRFSLGQNGNTKLFVIGLNPSTADADKSDQTMRKVKGFVERQKKFGGFVMLNLCPLRATNPKALPILEEKELICLAGCNGRAIHRILKRQNAPTIWAAWGNNIKNRHYLMRYLQAIVKVAMKKKAEWVMTGELTKRGHPRHPSRLGDEIEFRHFNVEEYLCDFSTLR